MPVGPVDLTFPPPRSFDYKETSGVRRKLRIARKTANARGGPERRSQKSSDSDENCERGRGKRAKARTI